ENDRLRSNHPVVRSVFCLHAAGPAGALPGYDESSFPSRGGYDVVVPAAHLGCRDDALPDEGHRFPPLVTSQIVRGFSSESGPGLGPCPICRSPIAAPIAAVNLIG